METKKCWKCEEEKELSCYYSDSSRPDKVTSQCKKCSSLIAKEYYNKNKEKIKKQKLEYWEANKERELQRAREWKKNNPEKVKEYKSSSKVREKENLCNKRRRSTPRGKIDNAISGGIYKHLQYNKIKKSNRHWEDIVGYTLEQLMQHLESQFKSDMSWDNYGVYWHIDHIKPKSWFLYESIQDESFKECWALSNLQPLLATENCSKQDRYEG